MSRTAQIKLTSRSLENTVIKALRMAPLVLAISALIVCNWLGEAAHDWVRVLSGVTFLFLISEDYFLKPRAWPAIVAFGLEAALMLPSGHGEQMISLSLVLFGAVYLIRDRGLNILLNVD